MGQWFSRGVGSESFFTGLDGKLDNLQQRLDRLEVREKDRFYLLSLGILQSDPSTYWRFIGSLRRTFVNCH